MAQTVHILKTSGFILLIVLGVALLIFTLLGIYQTYRVEHRRDNQIFRAGKLPAQAPDGFHKGNRFEGFGEDWQGKVFYAETQSGINRFTDGDRFTFKTYPAKGLRGKDQKVLRIDYSQPGNPWWLHFIVDEIVETEPGHYLGKVHLRVIPGMPFTLTYFELQK